MSHLTSAQQQAFEQLIQTKVGETLLDFWPGNPNPKNELSLQLKEDESPVTAADFAANELICGYLRDTFKEDGIFSEEEEIDPIIYEKERVWIVDPLDGTKWFADGEDEFMVLVALSVNHKIEYGLMYFPVKKLLLTATRGSGIHLNGEKLSVSKRTALEPGSVYYKKCELPNLKKFYGDDVHSGTAILNLIKGNKDATIFPMNHLGEYDVAAPAILIEEAGGKVTDETGGDFLFCKKDSPSKYFVGSNTHTHKEVLQNL